MSKRKLEEDQFAAQAEAQAEAALNDTNKRWRPGRSEQEEIYGEFSGSYPSCCCYCRRLHAFPSSIGLSYKFISATPPHLLIILTYIHTINLISTSSSSFTSTHANILLFFLFFFFSFQLRLSDLSLTHRRDSINKRGPGGTPRLQTTLTLILILTTTTISISPWRLNSCSPSLSTHLSRITSSLPSTTSSRALSSSISSGCVSPWAPLPTKSPSRALRNRR